MHRVSPFASLLLANLSFAVAAPCQAVPRIVSQTPAHGAEVDAKTTTELVVEFDVAMQPAQSVCGGGPAFPEIEGRVHWRNARTLVVPVELRPDHGYSLSLNCPAASNFRSVAGGVLPPTPWSFTTLPAKPRKPAEQKQRNREALKQLLDVLANHYSHRDLRVKDWKQLEQQHTAAVLAARTDRGFAQAAATMLAPTGDLHLYLRLGEHVFGTGSRTVDSLFRRELLPRYVTAAPAGPQVLAGRTGDGIGYLLIAAWNQELDPDVVGGAITELADTEAMVVDVRPNSGGDESLALRIAAWFVEGTRTYAKNRYRTGPGKHDFGPVFDRRITGHGPDRHYGRPIAVFTSRCVMSSNESFVLMLRQARDCTVVGQPTFGSSGNPKPHVLANGVTAVVPSWVDLLPDGSPFEGIGIQPDVLVPCTPEDLATKDPILERALAALRAKVK
jgi:carboxyl-terminal processing protease